jgi:positive regulator of sigma E activity
VAGYNGVRNPKNKAMNSGSYIFRISQKEIKRRKKAYVTLYLSLLSGFSVTTILSTSIGFSSGLILFLCFAVMFASLGLLTFASFRSFSKIVISLNSHQLERKTDKTRVNCPINEIENIFVKRTSYGNIREMKITQINGISFFINALEDFEVFYEKLRNYFGTEVKVKTFSEPINYDHRFFYVFFGLPIGLSIPLLISIFISLDTEKARFVLYSVSLFISIFGVYFVFAKPYSRRYGNHKQIIDFLFGSAFIVVGCFIFFQQYL